MTKREIFFIVKILWDFALLKEVVCLSYLFLVFLLGHKPNLTNRTYFRAILKTKDNLKFVKTFSVPAVHTLEYHLKKILEHEKPTDSCLFVCILLNLYKCNGTGERHRKLNCNKVFSWYLKKKMNGLQIIFENVDMQLKQDVPVRGNSLWLRFWVTTRIITVFWEPSICLYHNTYPDVWGC